MIEVLDLNFGKLEIATEDLTSVTLSSFWNDDATRTNRVFAGWYGDAEEGQAYTDEFSMIVKGSDKKDYLITWQFERIKGEECEDEDLDWNDISNINVEAI